MTSAVWQRLNDLATCLCAQCLDSSECGETPPLCFCGIVPGQEVALEYHGNCDDVCGMAWVRMTSLYPAIQVGQVNTNSGNCASMTGVDVELGIMRCMPVGEADGSPPSAEQLLAATELQVKDALALWQAVMCCQGSSDFLVGQYQPFGPEGGIVGGTLEVNFLEA